MPNTGLTGAGRRVYAAGVGTPDQSARRTVKAVAVLSFCMVVGIFATKENLHDGGGTALLFLTALVVFGAMLHSMGTWPKDD